MTDTVKIADIVEQVRELISTADYSRNHKIALPWRYLVETKRQVLSVTDDLQPIFKTTERTFDVNSDGLTLFGFNVVYHPELDNPILLNNDETH